MILRATTSASKPSSPTANPTPARWRPSCRSRGRPRAPCRPTRTSTSSGSSTPPGRRVRCGASRLWLPGRARGFARAVHRGWDHVDWADGGRHRADGRQARRPRAAADAGVPPCLARWCRRRHRDGPASALARLAARRQGRAGGGGSGMRVIERRGDVQYARAARRESQVLRPARGVHRALPRAAPPRRGPTDRRPPRRLVIVGDRDCSIQRRYQKLIEEAPAPRRPTPCVRLARGGGRRASVDYTNAGTVEFLSRATSSSSSR